MVFGVLAAVLLAAGTAFLIFRDPSHFTGSVTKEPDAYRLDAQYMNGIDAHTMALNAGMCWPSASRRRKERFIWKSKHRMGAFYIPGTGKAQRISP